MDIAPLSAFKEEYDQKQHSESVRVETFVQEKFSSWRVFSVPVVSLIKMVQMTVSIFILTGVLGTFIGLTISLGSINGTGDQLVENVASVLSGIDIAFYTSIAGMGFSLIMTVLLKVFNNEHMLTDIMLKVESFLEGNEKNGMGRLIDVSESINQSIVNLQKSNQQSLQGIEQAFEGFQEYTTGLQQSAQDLAKFNEGLSSNLTKFQELFENMKEVTDGFSEGTKRLNENFDSLFSYFKNLDRKNERMVKAFENTFEKVKEVSTAQVDTLDKFDESVVDLKTFTSSILQEQKSVQDTFDRIMHQCNELTNKMEAHNKDFKQVFGSDLHSELSGISSYLGQLTKDFDRLGESIVQLPQALEVINRTQAEHKHLLSDRFEELKEFNRNFNEHLKKHVTDSMAFEKHMQEASQTYEQVGMKNNQLIQEINSTITQMNQVFHNKENQLEASVGILKDTLSSYVNSLEGTLGDRIDHVVRNISNSLETTNDSIKREFQEIRRLSEEILQSNSRYTQQMLQELSREIQSLNRQLGIIGQQQAAPRQNGMGPNMGMRQNEY